MITCPNCGWSNEAGSRFCENCGADLRSLAPPADAGGTAIQPPPPPAPSPVPPPRTEIPPTSPEWRMAPLPPEEPPPRRRRTWLWIVIGFFGAIVLCCCAVTVWASTVGEERVQRWATEISDYMTETAATREAQ